ncbi:MAG TPA: hypothetical protein VFX84_00885 [Candidatus Saccharimonadales bacterium]|nr:hypothetical protein [Candidatus Saccharimonadales bacterium]
MDKRYLHHLWTKLRWVSPWYFLLLAVVCGVVCVFALRANNQRMIELRDAVYAADRNNTGVKKPLQELQAYVTSHMNTDLSAGNTSVYPPIQLKYTYERLVAAQKKRLLEANAGLYSQAQAHCESLNASDFSGRNRVPCIAQYVREHGNASQRAPAIPDALYKFSFASPRWSPDLAGWSMALAALSGLLFVVTLAGRRWLRRQVR